MKINPTNTPMTLIDHLSELRVRLFRSVIALIMGMGIALAFSKKIFHLLQLPMIQVLPPESYFIVTSPFESYMAYFKVSLLAGFFIASPFIFYQFWKFVTPALKQKEKRYVLPFAVSSAFLFTSGALFGYFIVFPTGFYYVNLILEDTAIRFLPGMQNYLGVAITMLLAFGITFELPLFIFLLGKLGVISYQHIKMYRRYVIVLLFVLAAILTPGPDVLSQCLLAFPLWILYELGGLTLIFMTKKA